MSFEKRESCKNLCFAIEKPPGAGLNQQRAVKKENYGDTKEICYYISTMSATGKV